MGNCELLILNLNAELGEGSLSLVCAQVDDDDYRQPVYSIRSKKEKIIVR